jgi:MIP family channel proteins
MGNGHHSAKPQNIIAQQLWFQVRMKKLLAEFIGTFFLVFAGTGAIIVNDVSGGTISHVGIALTFGLVVLTMIYAVGDISGAHLNPAVTLGFFLARRFAVSQVVPYILSQCAGAFAASLLLRSLFPTHATLGATLPSGSVWQSFVFELVLTAMLMFVILSVSIGSKERGIVAGIVVGAVIALEAMFAGPICGASMNPARSIAPAVVSFHLTSLWLYIVAPICGAALAVIVCHYLHDDCCTVPSSKQLPTPLSTP